MEFNSVDEEHHLSTLETMRLCYEAMEDGLTMRPRAAERTGQMNEGIGPDAIRANRERVRAIQAEHQALQLAEQTAANERWSSAKPWDW